MQANLQILLKDLKNILEMYTAAASQAFNITIFGIWSPISVISINKPIRFLLKNSSYHTQWQISEMWHRKIKDVPKNVHEWYIIGFC